MSCQLAQFRNAEKEQWREDFNRVGKRGQRVKYKKYKPGSHELEAGDSQSSEKVCWQFPSKVYNGLEAFSAFKTNISVFLGRSEKQLWGVAALRFHYMPLAPELNSADTQMNKIFVFKEHRVYKGREKMW